MYFHFVCRTSSEPLSDSMELPTSNARNPLNFESFQLEAMWDMAAAYGSAHRSGDTRLGLQSATTSHNVLLWDDGFAPPAISSSLTSASSSPSDAHPIPGSSSPKSRDSESLRVKSDPRVVVNPTDNTGRISKKFKCDQRVVEIELSRTTEDNIPISEESLQTIESRGVDANEDWRLCVDAACLMSVFDPQQQMKVYRRDWEAGLDMRGCYTAIGVVTFDTQSAMDISVKYLMEKLPEVAKPTDNLHYLKAMVEHLQQQHKMIMKRKTQSNQNVWDIYYGAMAKALQNEKAKKETQGISTNTSLGYFVKPPIPSHKG
ncbi:hypothetical protein DFJ43DRAFT_1164744 [Lentinula guzmanii]|uniref:Uncharacterized protein n=1 Tax=Lentinula guzmanii TaxID=2804957 RepID=A0AA38JRH2_9AGAR|nr:hypothetical protein DFJ43DRAFT_1164744 [Lentinula guzmanii]